MVGGKVAKRLELTDGRSRVSLAPDMGGGIAGMWTKDGVPVLRPLVAGVGPFGLASNVLVPFSNRISGGGFTFEGAHNVVPLNLEGQKFPIHGDGFQKPWDVTNQTSINAEIYLSDGGTGPWAYEARQRFALENGRLTVTLSMTNTGPRLPFGGGFHPWFPRLADTRLRFAAHSVWLEDADHLPTEKIALADNPDWDVGTSGALPQGLINNAFVGWDGRAGFDQPSLGITVDLCAQAPLDTAIVYSPDAQADFFCFEPVSHAVDAHNQPEQPGLAVLETGETLTLEMQIGWRNYENPA